MDRRRAESRRRNAGKRLITAEPWDFTSWNAGEPNDWPTNVEDGQEQYLSMTAYFTGGRGGTVWNDNALQGVPAGYLVEYPVPEPASAVLIGLAAGILLTRRPRREQAPSRTSVATAPSGG